MDSESVGPGQPLDSHWLQHIVTLVGQECDKLDEDKDTDPFQMYIKEQQMSRFPQPVVLLTKEYESMARWVTTRLAPSHNGACSYFMQY